METNNTNQATSGLGMTRVDLSFTLDGTIVTFTRKDHSTKGEKLTVNITYEKSVNTLNEAEKALLISLLKDVLPLETRLAISRETKTILDFEINESKSNV